MIYFFANFYSDQANGPARFARELRRHAPADAVTILSPDVSPRDRRAGVVELRQPPPYVRTTLLTQLWRSRYYASVLRRVGATANDVAVFNNATSGLRTYARFPGRAIGFINDYAKVDLETGHYPVAARQSARLLRALERRAARSAHRVVANSYDLQARICAAYELPPERVPVVYKGVDFSQVSRRPAGGSPAPPSIFYLKSDIHVGGLRYLLSAFETCRAASPGLRLRVGGATRERVERAFGPLPAGVTALGRLSAHSVRDEFARATVFCVPALAEALGVANIEAMAHGVPVVTTDVGGIPEVTDGGRLAWTCSPGDVAALARSLMEVLHGGAAVRLRVDEAASHVRAKFAITRSVARLLEIAGHA